MSEYLHECFIFDHINGLIFWKSRPPHHFKSHRETKLINTRQAGKQAGCVGRDGYLRVRFNGRSHLIHRVIWQMIYGEIPESMQVDHINHNRTDNRVSNLRLVSKKENLKNKSRSRLNTTGESGISFRKDSGKFLARISIDGKRKSLGSFETLEDALLARKKEMEKQGYHANHGRNCDEI
ncbi:HNH homing endonuclease [Pantoea phage PA-1]